MIFRRILFTLFLIQTFLPLSFADEISFPFVAEVKEDNVNIRAGESELFDSLYKLSKGEQVIAIDQGFGWIKVQLPAGADAYVSADFVHALNSSKGIVTGKRVNVRTRPALDGFPMGQLKEGDALTIRNTVDGWHRIVPPREFVGWVREDLIFFHSRYDASAAIRLAVEHDDEENLSAIGDSRTETLTADLSEVPAEVLEPAPVTFRLVGLLEPQPYFEQDGIYYRLTINDQPVYMLKGIGKLCDPLLYYQVELEGFMSPSGQGQYPYPVVEVKKLQLFT